MQSQDAIAGSSSSSSSRSRIRDDDCLKRFLLLRLLPLPIVVILQYGIWVDLPVEEDLFEQIVFS